MPFSLSLRTSIGASGTNTNVLSGSALEFLNQAVVLTILANMDGAATGSHSLTMNLAATPIAPIPLSALNEASTAGTLKQDEDLVLSNFPVPAGARLVQAVSNSDAANAHNYNGRYFVQ